MFLTNLFLHINLYNSMELLPLLRGETEMGVSSTVYFAAVSFNNLPKPALIVDKKLDYLFLSLCFYMSQ